MFQVITRFFKEIPVIIRKRKSFVYIIIYMISIWLIFALIFSNTEKIPIIDSLYWSLSTMTTVGYGDITPITGIGKMVGLDPFSQDDFTGEFETNYIGKAKLALKLLNKNYDWVVVHVKAPDLAGHDNDIEKKAKIIENIDKMAGIFYNNIDLSRCYFTFTADHSTPCEVRDHTSDPVPSFISGIDVRRDGIFNAGESYFKNGSLNNFKANDLFLIQMDYMGFTKKYGA